MPTRWTTFPIKLEGGLITNLGRLEQGLLAPGSATKLQNFEPSIEKGYSKIKGYEKFTETAVPGTGQIWGIVTTDPTTCLVVRDGKYQYWNTSAWVEKATLPSPAISRIKSDRFNFNGTQKTVIVDGVNKPAIFDHTLATVTYLGTVPADVNGAKDVVIYKNHIFYGKGVMLTFGSPYSDTDFSSGLGAGQINIGDTITGLKVFRDQLIIFSLNSIRRLVGNTIDDFQLLDITRNTGCLCGHTIQEVGGDIMYLGPDGIRYLSATERNEDFGLNRASEKIQKNILSIVNSNCLYSSTTISAKNQYRIFSYVDNIPSSASESFLATKYSDQSADNIAWAKLVGFKVYSMSKLQERDREVILFVSDTDYVYQMEVGNSFDGEDIESIFETPYMPITDSKIRKTIYKHSLYAKPDGPISVTVTLKYDYLQTGSSQPPAFTISGGDDAVLWGAPGTMWGSFSWGSSSEENYYNNTLGSGFTVAINYYDKSQSPSYNLNFITLEFRENERR